MRYMNLSHGESFYLYSFIFGFGKESLSYFLLLSFSIREQGSLLFFILFLFVLQAQSALYPLESS